MSYRGGDDGDDGGYDPEQINEGDDDEQNKWKRPEPQKEQLLFLVDASSSMFENVTVQGTATTYFELVMRAIADVTKSRIIQSPDDQVGVVFYNTRAKANESNFPHVYQLFAMDAPNAAMITAVRKMTVDDFKERIGGEDPPADDPASGLYYALWMAKQAFGRSTTTYKQMVLFTNEANPAGTGPLSRAHRERVMTRVSELGESGASMRLFPLAAVARPFHYAVFWKEVLGALRDTGSGEAGASQEEAAASGQAEDEQMLAELALASEQRADPLRVILSMFDNFKRRLSKKRSTLSARWTIARGTHISIRGYLLVADSKATNTAAVLVHKVTNEPVKTSTAYVATDTGEVVQRTQITKCSFKVDKKPEDRLPRVIFQKSEIAAAKAVKPPGLHLLGFKPLSCLKDHHQLTHSTFIRPHEADLKGSTATFIALWRAMLAQKRFALCRFVRNRASAPGLVALVAQDEVLSEYGGQLEPPGMHMIPLPYWDDIRFQEKAAERVIADDHFISAAEAVVDALMLERDGAEPFSMTNVRNPYLQRHFQIIEALALQEPIPEPEADPTLPQPELFESAEAQAVLEAFKEARAAAGAAAGAAGGSKKRKAADGEAGGGARATKAAKAEAAEDGYAAFDWDVLARQGQLATLTIPHLKLYLERHKLKVSGAKGVLIDRVTEHMGLRG